MANKHRKRYPSGSMELANWNQFKALLALDTADVWHGLGDDNAALVESNRQNEYAARLWKAHAESAPQFTDREKGILSYLVECIANGSEQVTINGTKVSELEALRLLYKLVK